MIILYEKDERSFTSLGIGVLSDAIEPIVTEGLNGSYELEMDYPINGQLYNEIKTERLIYCKPNEFDDPQPFRIYNISKPLNGVITINAEHISYDTAGYPVRPFSVSAESEPGQLTPIQKIFTNIKEKCMVSDNNMPFTFDVDDITETKAFQISKPTNMRSILLGDESVASVYKGEYKYDKFKIELLKRRGSNRGFEIRYGKNMTDFEQQLNSESKYTAVFPFYDSVYTTTKTVEKKVYEYRYLADKDPEGNTPDAFSDYWLSLEENGVGVKPTKYMNAIQIAPIEVYIRSTREEYSKEWFSLSEGGMWFEPRKYQTYKVIGDSVHTGDQSLVGKIYQWDIHTENPERYIESPGVYKWSNIKDARIVNPDALLSEAGEEEIYGPNWLSFSFEVFGIDIDLKNTANMPTPGQLYRIKESVEEQSSYIGQIWECYIDEDPTIKKRCYRKYADSSTSWIVPDPIPEPTKIQQIPETELNETYVDLTTYNDAWINIKEGTEPYTAGWLVGLKDSSYVIVPAEGEFYKVLEDYPRAKPSYIYNDEDEFGLFWLGPSKDEYYEPEDGQLFRIIDTDSQYYDKVFRWYDEILIEGHVYSRYVEVEEYYKNKIYEWKKLEDGTFKYVEYENFDQRKPFIYVTPEYELNQNDSRVLMLDLTSDFDDKPTIAQLTEVAEKYMAENDLIHDKDSVTVSFAKLSKSKEYEQYKFLEHVELGDDITIINERYNTKIKARVLKVSYDVNKHEYTEIELGQEKESLVNSSVSRHDAVSVLRNDAEYSDKSTVVDLLIKSLTADYISATNAKLSQAQIDELKTDYIISQIIDASQANIKNLITSTIETEVLNITGSINMIGDSSILLSNGQYRMDSDGYVYVDHIDCKGALAASKLTSFLDSSANKVLPIDVLADINMPSSNINTQSIVISKRGFISFKDNEGDIGATLSYNLGEKKHFKASVIGSSLFYDSIISRNYKFRVAINITSEPISAPVDVKLLVYYNGILGGEKYWFTYSETITIPSMSIGEHTFETGPIGKGFSFIPGTIEEVYLVDGDKDIIISETNSLNVDKNFYPSEPNSYTLGSVGYRWNDLYLTDIGSVKNKLKDLEDRLTALEPQTMLAPSIDENANEEGETDENL